MLSGVFLLIAILVVEKFGHLHATIYYIPNGTSANKCHFVVQIRIQQTYNLSDRSSMYPHSNSLSPAILEVVQSCKHAPLNTPHLLQTVSHAIQRANHFPPSMIQPILQSLGLLLDRNISLAEVIHCLSQLQPHLSPPQLADIHHSISKKYPPWVGLQQQVDNILGYNSNLLSPFLYLLEAVSDWYRGLIEQHQYCIKESFLFILDHAHALLQLPSDNLNQEVEESILLKLSFLTELALTSEEVAQLILAEQQIREFILHCLLHFANITNSLTHSDILRFFAINLRHLVELLQQSVEGIPQYLTTLLMKTCRNASFQRHFSNTEHFQGLVVTVLNLWLLFDWSMDGDVHWLWTLKMAGDLLEIPPSGQKSQLIQLQALFREVSTTLALQ